MLLPAMLLACAAAAGCRGERDAAGAGDTGAAAAAGGASEMGQAIEDFATHVSQTDEQQDAGRQHTYAVEGIRRLATALAAVARRDTAGGSAAQAVQAQADSLRQLADHLEHGDPQSPQHADMVRAAFMRAANAFAAVQERRFPSMSAETGQIRQAAAAIRPGRPLLSQSRDVETFFRRTRDALRTMVTLES